MARKQSGDFCSERETARRLDAILQAAFAGPPTPRRHSNSPRGVPKIGAQEAFTPPSPAQEERGLLSSSVFGSDDPQPLGYH